MTLNTNDDETSTSSSDSEDSTDELNFDGEDGLNENEENSETEPPVFDDSKEIDYKVKYKQTFEEVLSLNDVFILNLDAQKVGQSLRIATALSNFTCQVQNIEAGNKSSVELLEHKEKIVDVKLGSSDNQLSSIVYTGSEDGTIKIWDLRLKSKIVSIFKDDTDQSVKPLSCFDVSCGGRFLAGGTDVLKDDAFILFWDIRSTKLLGGYWDTHQGDITQVKFHPNEEKNIISGSTDGIINLFDVTQTTESDALQSSFNTNSSIGNLRWLNNKNGDSIISCITHTEDAQFWHTTDSFPFINIPRDTLNSSMNIIPDLYSQVINCHQTDKNGNIMLLAGINYGKGEYLQSFNVNNDSVLSPRTLFKNNKQIIRCSWYDLDCGLMITGGEAGILNIWVPNDKNEEVTNKCSLKELPKVSKKYRTSKPY